MDNYFAALNAINVNGKTEKKNGLTYLSWAWAWGEVKKLHPDATYTVYENAEGLNYHHDSKTAWVKTGVTVNGIEHDAGEGCLSRWFMIDAIKPGDSFALESGGCAAALEGYTLGSMLFVR